MPIFKKGPTRREKLCTKKKKKHANNNLAGKVNKLTLSKLNTHLTIILLFLFSLVVYNFFETKFIDTIVTY